MQVIFLWEHYFMHWKLKQGSSYDLMKKWVMMLSCLGNHEFDFGPEKLASLINNAASGGEIPVFVKWKYCI